MRLLAFPELKSNAGPVRERLLAAGADAAILDAWERIAKEHITAEPEDDEY